MTQLDIELVLKAFYSARFLKFPSIALCGKLI